MADASLPSTYSQFTLFRELSNSLYPHDWHTFVETWHSMVAVNAPVAEFTYNLIPFFSNVRKLQPVFQRYMKFAQQVKRKQAFGVAYFCRGGTKPCN